VKPRLWVTGLGLVTPLGVGVEATWSELIRGRSAIGPIRLFDASAQRVGRAAEVGEVAVPREPRGAWSRTSAMALLAAQEALAMARIEPARTRVGLVVGGTTAGMFETEQLLARLHAEPEDGERLVDLLSHPLTSTGDCLERRLGPFIRVRSLSSACSSGANAVVVGAAWLLSGEVDAVVAGGCDGLCRLTLSGFNSLGAIDPETCRPFDRRRRGTILGEGAGFLVLEQAGRASARLADPVAELSGWALGCEAHHITNPAPDGHAMAGVIHRALARAGLSPRDVDYVNAHGTGTLANDAMEAAALARALGAEIDRVPVSSCKGQIGHTLGAAGGIEAALTALVVARRVLVPTAGLDEPDAALGLVHVPHVGRAVPRVRAALSNAFGFGGMGTVLVFTEPAAAAARKSPWQERGDDPGHETETGVVTGVSVAGALGLLGAEACSELPELAPRENPAGLDPDEHLDGDRARRLDRTARLAAVAVERALCDASASAGDVGLVFGSAFGSVDDCARFMHRIATKGVRAASPADFPNLVPSSPVGHVSIYSRMHGPAFMTANLATSGEDAFAQALQLVCAGEVDRVVACSSELRSEIVERAFAPLFDGLRSSARHSDLAAAIVVESRTEARSRGARVLARITQVLEWRGDGAGAGAAIRGPNSARPQVICARSEDRVEDFVSRTPWRSCQRWFCSRTLGESGALGAAAICVAAARLGAGRVSEALVVGLAPGRGYAIVLGAP